MKQILTYIGIIVFSIIGLFSFSGTTFAENNQSTFSVNAEQSNYQINKEKTYFDLSLPINETVPLIVHVTNNSDKTIDVIGKLSLATTNLNGVVEYGETSNQLNDKVPFDLTKVASFEKDRQTIEPGQTVDFILNISVPTKDYAGLVAGGITFKDITKETKNDDDKSMFTNKFAYAIALLIHGDKTALENKASLVDVKPNQVNSRNTIDATIKNEEANYINKVSIDALVEDSENKTVLEEKKKDMQIAPNSMFNFPIYYDKKEMKAGNYTLKMTVRSEKNEWKFEKAFTITKEKADTLNKSDVIVKDGKEDVSGLIIILLGMIAILLSILFLLIKKRK